MKNAEFFLASSLEKVMPTRRPAVLAEGARLSAWRGTRASVQLVYRQLSGTYPYVGFSFQVSGAPVKEKCYKVNLVPVENPCYDSADEDFISKDPGLFPDVLQPLEDSVIRPMPHQYRSIWLSWEIPQDLPAKDYDVCIEICYPSAGWMQSGKLFRCPEDEQTITTLHFTLSVKNAELTEIPLITKIGFHADCLADHYKVPLFSEEHWALIENHIRAAGDLRFNMLCAPVFTPPYDTACDTYRPTIQLVDVYLDNGRYSFGYEKLERWLRICRENGIQYLSMPALFTQWGAVATPKIEAVVDGVTKRIFGWDVPATSPDYLEFLTVFIPAVRRKLDELGYDKDHVFFHISDEPQEGQLDQYKKVQSKLADMLSDALCTDALANPEFVRSGAVRLPNIPIDEYDKFEDLNLEKFFVYYCCVQDNQVSNRFIAMESSRNRIMGVLAYIIRPMGLSHWAFNFYYSSYAFYKIDPYSSAHAEWCFPAGDSYLVYPGEKGEVIYSLRAEVLRDAFEDLRSLQTLEQMIGREEVLKLVYEGTDIGKFTFKNYPHGPEYILSLRERVADALDRCIAES